MYDVLVIGGGQAGLATGYHLKQLGVKFVIFEATHETAGSWPHYYDSLKLFSPARYSALPGLPFPGDPDRYPSRNEVIAYLQDYAIHFDLPIKFNARVTATTKQNNIFQATTLGGEQYQARSVIVATGAFNRPNLPHLPGQSDFQGEILHSSQYCQPTPYRGKRIVVIGAGNSAVQIAVELAQVAKVILTSRTPIKFQRQHILGRDIHFWLKVTGLDTLYLPHRKVAPTSRSVLDTGIYRTAIQQGKPTYKPMFARFTPDGVIWSEGGSEPIDTAIFATGYEPNVPFLANSGVLNDHQQIQQKAGIATIPGLYFVGLSGQRSIASATLRGVGADAQYVIAHLVRYLRTANKNQLTTSEAR